LRDRFENKMLKIKKLEGKTVGADLRYFCGDESIYSFE
jgi:hypothetical protein